MPKENEPKEKAPLFLARLSADSLCSSELPGVNKTRFAQTVFNAYPAAPPVLGGDPMGEHLLTTTAKTPNLSPHEDSLFATIYHKRVFPAAQSLLTKAFLALHFCNLFDKFITLPTFFLLAPNPPFTHRNYLRQLNKK